MASDRPPSRLSRFFHKRSSSTAANEATSSEPPPIPRGPSESRHSRNRSSQSGLRQMAQRTGRSLSRSRQRPQTSPGLELVSDPVPTLSHRRTSSIQVVRHNGKPPDVSPSSRLSSDLRHLTLDHVSRDGRDPNTYRIDPYAARRNPQGVTQDVSPYSGDEPDYPVAFAMASAYSNAFHDPYSEDVADRNIAHPQWPLRSGTHQPTVLVPDRTSSLYHADLSDYPDPLMIPALDQQRSLAHQPDPGNLRRSVHRDVPDDAAAAESNRRGSSNYERLERVRRASLQKPLPGIPNEGFADHRDLPDLPDQERYDSAMDSELGKERGYLVKDSKHPVDLEGILDTTNTEEVHENIVWAPAVTHETVVVDTHEILEESITREYHNHHVYHRVLPVVDVEVLPPRHFVPTPNGGLYEISESEIPGGTSVNLQQIMQDAVSRAIPTAHPSTGPRRFTARQFHGSEGDFQESVAPEGHPRTEQWWVHPPTLATGGQETGQTLPFHFGSRDPDNDGLTSYHPEQASPSSTRRSPTLARKPVPSTSMRAA